MKLKLGVLLLASSAMIAPAAAQQGQPNPNQAAAKAILQAADKAIGASNVRSVAVTATGWIGSPGQQFAQGDLPRADMKSFTLTLDYPSKSSKTDYVRVQGNNPTRGGGGIPIQGEARSTELVNGNVAWNLNAQGQPAPQAGTAAGCAVGCPCAFKFHAVLPLTNSVVRASPWIGIPPPPRGGLFP